MDDTTAEFVRNRALHRCEYCHLPERYSKLKFHIEHIVARQHRSDETLENLALACGFCNRHKGPNLAGLDPDTGHMTRLFNPRTDQWNAHFKFDGADISGTDAIGKATVTVLAMNHPQQLDVRQALIDEGIFSI